jgi:hypothetical protein
MTKTIGVVESINDKKSDFNIKRYKIGKIHSEGPIKSIDARMTNKKLFEKESSNFTNIIFETPKKIDADVINLVVSGKDSYVKTFFGFSEWMHNFENVISPTFNFNPFSIYEKIEDLSGFFNYYYTFSKTFLFVPNVNSIEIIYEIGKNGNKRKTGENQIIKIEEYINFVNDTYEILNDHNNKPIFVPFSLKFSMEEIQRLVKGYITKGYPHIWIDFEGAKTTDLAKLGKLKQFYSMLRKAERFNDTILYITNVKREITTNSQKDENPSSDILTSLCGGNFIGVNQERINPNPLSPVIPEVLQNLWEHRARVFNPESYYYIRRNLAGVDEKTSELLLDKQYNTLFNSKQLNIEFHNQTDQFLKDFDFEEYICNKKNDFKLFGGTIKTTDFL